MSPGVIFLLKHPAVDESKNAGEDTRRVTGFLDLSHSFKDREGVLDAEEDRNEADRCQPVDGQVDLVR